jgi:putative oxidoreductase
MPRGTRDAPRKRVRAIVPIARACFALIFIVAVFDCFTGATIDHAAAHGVPLAGVVVPLSGILALAGGISVLLGYRARFGAFLIVLFLVPVTLVMHRFWGLHDPHLAALQQEMFLKNVSIFGGALLVIYYGAGPVSLDG